MKLFLNLFQHGFTVIILRVLSAGLLFIAQVIIAKQFGATTTGKYFLLFSYMVIGSIIARRGLDTWSYQQLSGQTKSTNEASSIVAQAMLRTIFNSLVISVVTAFLIFVTPSLQTPFHIINSNPIVFTLSVLGFSIIMTASEILKAFNKIAVSMLISGVIYPVIMILLFIITDQKEANLLIIHSTAISFNALAGIWLLLRITNFRIKSFHYKSSPSISVTGAFWVNSIVHRAIIPWSPIVFLSLFASDEIVGWFAVSMRIAVFASFFSVAIVTAVYPKLLDPKKTDINLRKTQLIVAAKRLFIMLFPLVLTPLLIVLLIPDIIIGFFGKEFYEATSILPYLTISQSVFSFSLIFQYYFIFRGNSRHIYTTAVALGVSSTLLLIPATLLASPLFISLAVLISQLIYFSHLLLYYIRDLNSELK